MEAEKKFKREIVWFNVVGFLVLHLLAVFGLFQIFFCQTKTVIWALLYLLVTSVGVTIGAHRMYSHKGFKATFGTRLVLVLLHTAAGQNCMYIWVRDHRQHHKFSDTDADPHNAKRGFFFSHIGWLMARKHPEVIRKGKTIDMSDLEADSLIMFQKKYYKSLYTFFAIAVPVLVPVYGWNEDLFNSLFVSYFSRYLLQLNFTWLINSAAHIYGTREGWHNYHHAFPWDYRAAEFGLRYSITTWVIDLLAYFGLVYDLKTATSEVVRKTAAKRGDNTHPQLGDGNIKTFDMKKITDNESCEYCKDCEIADRIISAKG